MPQPVWILDGGSNPPHSTTLLSHSMSHVEHPKTMLRRVRLTVGEDSFCALSTGSARTVVDHSLRTPTSQLASGWVEHIRTASLTPVSAKQPPVWLRFLKRSKGLAFQSGFGSEGIVGLGCSQFHPRRNGISTISVAYDSRANAFVCALAAGTNVLEHRSLTAKHKSGRSRLRRIWCSLRR